MPVVFRHSKRSPDEPTGRANARPMTGSAISGVFVLAMAPACRCAHAGYLLNQPQFQIGPIGVRVQQGPKLPPL